MPMRLSGLMSGMDTESVIEQLVMARRTKVDTAVKAQTKLKWKTDAWKSLNTKIKKLYDGTLSNLRFEGSYKKKTTKVSNSSVVSVITGENAMNSVQELEVDSLAKSAILTGGKIGDGKKNLTTDSRIAKVNDDYNFAYRGRINVTAGGKRTEIVLTGATTMGEIVQAFRDAGLNASFDATNQRFYLSSRDTGKDNDFTISAGDVNGLAMLEDLGLAYTDENITGYYDSIVKWNQAEVVEGRLQGRYDSRLKELTNRQNDLLHAQNVLYEELEELAEKYQTEFADCYDGGLFDPDKARAKVKELLAEDETDARGDGILKYAEFISWDQGMTQTEESLSEVNSKLTTDDDDNVVLVDAEKEAIKEKVTAEVAHEVEQAQLMLDALNQAAASTGAKKSKAEDAVIRLNGVEYTGSKNAFEINGLTLTLNSTTKETGPITLTTQDDTDGIYDMIKSFIKEYSELINEMDKLYNAESSKGYEPLTSEEKETMSEKEIEEWETKIKDSILRRDDTLGNISSALKQMMLSSIRVNGKQMYLTNFGIESLSYFTAAENEKSALHIDGDPDDPNTSGNADKLKSMIASDPQTVIDFFVEFSRNMYADLTERMAKTEYSSAYTIYEDVKMKNEYDSYTSKIKDLEKKLADYEDKWYNKFAQMETALAKLQSNASAVTSLLGG